MDFNEEFGIFLASLESDSNSGTDGGPPSDSETESEESDKRAGLILLELEFKLLVPHEKITAQTGVSRSGLYKAKIL